MAAYTEAINLMDYSAVVLPATKANEGGKKFNNNYSPLNNVDYKNWEAYKCSPITFLESTSGSESPPVIYYKIFDSEGCVVR